MRYISTRGAAPEISFDDVLLTGLARDGGLYVPATWPRYTKSELRSLRGLSYQEIAVRIMLPFIGDSISESDFANIVTETYRGFDHPAIAPLIEIGSDQWVCELFHGPTLAFKDYPLQLVGQLFDHVLKRQGRRVTIVGATSGDTGSAAMEAGRGVEGMEVFFFYPDHRVSEVQRRQMTTLNAPNAHAIALEGTFDDCQDMVKELFADLPFRDRHSLSAMNSINWARIMAQTVYYFTTALALGAPDRRVAFAVPTGNFGNIYAAYAARKMGLPIEKLIIGSNANDILTRYMDTGEMSMAPVVPTLSPSMDIQISSNFERLLFDHYRGSGESVAKAMTKFRSQSHVSFGKGRWQSMAKLFEAYRVGDNATKDVIATIYAESGTTLDPHTAIGVAAGRQADLEQDTALICMATAHPAKFPDAVEAATGNRPQLPPRLHDLMSREERTVRLANDTKVVKSYINEQLGDRNAA